MDQEKLQTYASLTRRLSCERTQEILNLLKESEKGMTGKEIETALKIRQSFRSQKMVPLIQLRLTRVKKIGKHRVFSVNYQKLKQLEAFIDI